MATLTKKDQQWLREKFGPRANFDPTERVLYGHDIAAMPKLIKPLVGNTAPHTIVQPGNEEELRALVAWASSKKIPLVPRGKGSSGYGGIIPTRKGIVVDFYRMKEVLAVDAAARRHQGHPRRRVRRNDPPPRGGPLLRQCADPDQGSAHRPRHRRNADRGGHGGQGRDHPRSLSLLRIPISRDEGKEEFPRRDPRPGRLCLSRAGQNVRRPERRGFEAVEGL